MSGRPLSRDKPDEQTTRQRLPRVITGKPNRTLVGHPNSNTGPKRPKGPRNFPMNQFEHRFDFLTSVRSRARGLMNRATLALAAIVAFLVTATPSSVWAGDQVLLRGLQGDWNGREW